MIIHMRIKGYNVMGKSKLCDITNNGLNILYDDKDLVKFKVFSNEFEICNYSTQFAAINIKYHKHFMLYLLLLLTQYFHSCMINWLCL